MGTGCPAPGHSAMLPSDQTARPACRERCVKPSSKNKPSCQNCAVMRLRLSCAKNHCQNRFSACVCVCVFVCICVTLSSITGLFLYRRLWAVVRPIPLWNHLVEIDSPFASNTHIDTYTIALKHADPYMQTQRGKTSHLVPWHRHFYERLEWHQLHSDKNGFCPGCWLSNTFWCHSRGRFIRSQIRLLTFTPKHISHTERRLTDLMHRITPCCIHFILRSSKYLITSGRFEGIRK